MLRLNAKAVQGSLTKEIGFYAERASIHSTPKPKVKDKPSLAIFKPSLFLINPKLAQTRAFDSMTDELPSWMSREMVSGTLSRLFPHCEWDLGSFYGEKPRLLWWALPSDNEGHAAVLSASTDGQVGWELLTMVIHALMCLYIFIWRAE